MPRPKRTIFTVSHVGWSVGDRTFPTRAAAITYARRQALKVHSTGGLAQVRLRNRAGRIATEWTYGDDPRRTKG